MNIFIRKCISYIYLFLIPIKVNVFLSALIILKYLIDIEIVFSFIYLYKKVLLVK